MKSMAQVQLTVWNLKSLLYNTKGVQERHLRRKFPVSFSQDTRIKQIPQEYKSCYITFEIISFCPGKKLSLWLTGNWCLPEVVRLFINPRPFTGMLHYSLRLLNFKTLAVTLHVRLPNIAVDGPKQPCLCSLPL